MNVFLSDWAGMLTTIAGAAAIILLIVAVAAIAPILLWWSLTELGWLHTPLTFWTWLALLIVIEVGRGVSVSFKR